MVPISVRVSEKINERLTDLSKKTGRPKNFYIREALEDYIEDMEDLFLAVEALGKQERVYTLEEAKKVLMEDGELEG